MTRDFDAEITEQVPDQRIAWKSTGGTGHDLERFKDFIENQPQAAAGAWRGEVKQDSTR